MLEVIKQGKIIAVDFDGTIVTDKFPEIGEPNLELVAWLKQYRANGGKVGRKQGYKKSDEAMREQYAEEIRLLRKGLSLRNISKITHTSVNTIRKCQSLIEK